MVRKFHNSSPWNVTLLSEDSKGGIPTRGTSNKQPLFKIQNFSAGELSLHSQKPTSKLYNEGLAKAVNVLFLNNGSVVVRPNTIRMANFVKDIDGKLHNDPIRRVERYYADELHKYPEETTSLPDITQVTDFDDVFKNEVNIEASLPPIKAVSFNYITGSGNSDIVTLFATADGKLVVEIIAHDQEINFYKLLNVKEHVNLAVTRMTQVKNCIFISSLSFENIYCIEKKYDEEKKISYEIKMIALPIGIDDKTKNKSKYITDLLFFQKRIWATSFTENCTIYGSSVGVYNQFTRADSYTMEALEEKSKFLEKKLELEKKIELRKEFETQSKHNYDLYTKMNKHMEDFKADSDRTEYDFYKRYSTTYFQQYDVANKKFLSLQKDDLEPKVKEIEEKLLLFSEHYAVKYNLLHDKITGIWWFFEWKNSLLIGTQTQVFSVTGTSFHPQICSSNIEVSLYLPYGVSYIKPIIYDKNNFVLVGKDRKKISMITQVDKKMETKELTQNCSYFTNDKIIQVVVQHSFIDIIWVLTEKGKLYSLSYNPATEIYAWSEQILGGKHYEIQSITVGNFQDEETLYLVVKRYATLVLERLKSLYSIYSSEMVDLLDCSSVNIDNDKLNLLPFDTTYFIGGGADKFSYVFRIYERNLNIFTSTKGEEAVVGYQDWKLTDKSIDVKGEYNIADIKKACLVKIDAKKEWEYLPSKEGSKATYGITKSIGYTYDAFIKLLPLTISSVPELATTFGACDIEITGVTISVSCAKNNDVNLTPASYINFEAEDIYILPKNVEKKQHDDNIIEYKYKYRNLSLKKDIQLTIGYPMIIIINSIEIEYNIANITRNT